MTKQSESKITQSDNSTYSRDLARTIDGKTVLNNWNGDTTYEFQCFELNYDIVHLKSNCKFNKHFLLSRNRYIFAQFSDFICR